MPDVVVFKIQALDRGFVSYGPENAEYREKLVDAKTQMLVYVDAWVKEYEKAQREPQK